MSYNKTVKGKQFIKRLQQHGVEIIRGRGKGGHVLVKHKGHQVTFPVHGDADFDPSFLRKVCNQLGIDPNDIL